MKLIAAVPAGFCHGHVKNELPNFRQRKSPDVIAHSRIGSVIRDIPSAHSFGGRAVSYHSRGGGRFYAWQAHTLHLCGKILSRILERNKLTIDHAILDAAPLLPLPNWLVNPLRHYQAINVWTCYHWTGFWKAVFRNHYFDVLLDECKKTWPWGGRQAVLDGYKSVYTNKLESISGNDIHFWYGTKEAFVAKPQVKHLLSLCPQAHIEVFQGMNHGQLLIDHPEEIAQRIMKIAE